VNGPGADPIYQFLKAEQPRATPFSSRSGGTPSGNVSWNYEKFLVGRDGRPAKRFKSAFDPLDFETDVRLLLARHPVTPDECAMHPGRIVCKADFDDLPAAIDFSQA